MQNRTTTSVAPRLFAKINHNNSYDSQKTEADHITPWYKGGQADADDCQMLCRDCNRRKGKQ